MKRSQLKTKLTRQVIPNFLNRYDCKLLFLKISSCPAGSWVPHQDFSLKITLAAVCVTFIVLRGAVLSV